MNNKFFVVGIVAAIIIIVCAVTTVYTWMVFDFFCEVYVENYYILDI